MTALAIIGGIAVCLFVMWLYRPRDPFTGEPRDTNTFPGD